MEEWKECKLTEIMDLLGGELLKPPILIIGMVIFLGFQLKILIVNEDTLEILKKKLQNLVLKIVLQRFFLKAIS